MEISKFIEVDLAHRLMNHSGRCKNLHGHRYKIEVIVDDKLDNNKDSSSEGMVIDFNDLKKIMNEVIDDKFDHSTIIYSGDTEFIDFFSKLQNKGYRVVIVDFISTAENLAQLWFNLLKKEFVKKNIKLKAVKVWETPTSSALYKDGDDNESN